MPLLVGGRGLKYASRIGVYIAMGIGRRSIKEHGPFPRDF